MVGRRAETNNGRGPTPPVVFIVWDEKAPPFCFSLSKTDHLAAAGAGLLVVNFYDMNLYDMTFWLPQLDCFKFNNTIII